MKHLELGRTTHSNRRRLKPPKCIYYLIGYKWDDKGNWTYQDEPDLSEMMVSVTLPDGTIAPIQQHTVHTPSITLGGQTPPSGLNALSSMTEKALDWAHKARNSCLQPRDFHISVHRKLWPKLKYGLYTNTSSFDDLVSAMHQPYHWMAPIGGLLRSAIKERSGSWTQGSMV
jgi:hypothetical protein